MIELSKDQQSAVEYSGSCLVTACPGSGKTRVLTERVIKAATEKASSRTRVVAVTFTNRGADEIASRLQEVELEPRSIWTGTIHSFAIEWILRPYGGYLPPMRHGFSVADEFTMRRLLNEAKSAFKLKYFDDVNTAFRRDGNPVTTNRLHWKVIQAYRESLRSRKLIDFDSVLYFAHKLLDERPEIAQTIASLISQVCIDEYQDTQDLQYAILGAIVRNAGKELNVFIVGDVDQAIYTSLGSISKTQEEIVREFGLKSIAHRPLSGNYRSTQRVVNFSANFREGIYAITSLASHALDRGCIAYRNGDCDRTQLPSILKDLVSHYRSQGVPEHEICILAPQWGMVSKVAKELLSLMPDVNLNAPGLSPLKYQRESVWFQVARLFLTDATSSRYRRRLYWAKDLVGVLEEELQAELSPDVRDPRKILRIQNSIQSAVPDGLEYLRDVIPRFLQAVGVSLSDHLQLEESYSEFLENFEQRRASSDDFASVATVENLRRVFQFPSGVVVNTCHGVKGEEYDVVICFGLHRGYVPHWNRIYDDDVDEEADAMRLLYVIASRARRYLHLFSERGHSTKKGDPYEATHELDNVRFDYDVVVIKAL